MINLSQNATEQSTCTLKSNNILSMKYILAMYVIEEGHFRCVPGFRAHQCVMYVTKVYSGIASPNITVTF